MKLGPTFQSRTVRMLQHFSGGCAMGSWQVHEAM